MVKSVIIQYLCWSFSKHSSVDESPKLSRILYLKVNDRILNFDSYLMIPKLGQIV